MTIEDQLRDRLQAETAGIDPPGDLLPSLARGHARRYKRARLALAGGSLMATALVAILLVGLLSSPPPEPPLNSVEVIQRARDADAAALGMIMYVEASNDAGYEVQQSWVLRSENLGRLKRGREGVDIVTRPGTYERIENTERRVVTIASDPKESADRAVLVPDLVGTPSTWLSQEPTSVRRADGEIHLTVPVEKVQGGPQSGCDLIISPDTYLPRRADFGIWHLDIKWLPATPETRKLLEHTVPPDYQHFEY